MGRLDEALAFVTRAQDLAEDLELHDFLPFVLTSLGDLLIRREDWQAAEAALAEAEKAAQRPGTDYPLGRGLFPALARAPRDGTHAGGDRAWPSAQSTWPTSWSLAQEEGKAWRALGQALLAEGAGPVLAIECLSAQPGSSGRPERLRGRPHQGAVGPGAVARSQGRLCRVTAQRGPGGRRPYPETPAETGNAYQSSVPVHGGGSWSNNRMAVDRSATPLARRR